MPQINEKTIKPEKVILKDGRKGYFISVPTEAIVTVEYQSASSSRKRPTAKIKVVRTTKGRSIVSALKEIKARKLNSNHPGRDFDSLMDEL